MAYQPIKVDMPLNKENKPKLKYTIQISKTVLFQIIRFSIRIDFSLTRLKFKTVLFETIQFSISTQFKLTVERLNT